jgi:Glu-tRNA(Gln) amidotransferase subunit E-like FAD-binding protein
VAKISDIIAGRETTEHEKADAFAAVAKASQEAADKTAADDRQKAIEVRALKRVGPTVIGTTLYQTIDGLEVHKSTVNLGDADVPDDGAPPDTGTPAPPLGVATQADPTAATAP